MPQSHEQQIGICSKPPVCVLFRDILVWVLYRETFVCNQCCDVFVTGMRNTRRLTCVLSFLSLVHCRDCVDTNWGGAGEYAAMPEAFTDMAILRWCPPLRGNRGLQAPQCQCLLLARLDSAGGHSNSQYRRCYYYAAVRTCDVMSNV